MDLIKIEPEVDPLDLQPHDNRDEEEKKPLTEEGNFVYLQVDQIKTEYVDHSYDLTPDVQLEESSAAVTFPATNCKVEDDSGELDPLKEPKVEATVEDEEEEEALPDSNATAHQRSVASEDTVAHAEVVKMGQYRQSSIYPDDPASAYSSYKNLITREKQLQTQSRSDRVAGENRTGSGDSYGEGSANALVQTQKRKKSFKCNRTY
ncbi:uncharacterized protein [Periplaneta americana]|uniref:uncharacterized protein n=1 Tax=Periplaneta americana TaxID=6978 RepID=UPI0037E9C620